MLNFRQFFFLQTSLTLTSAVLVRVKLATSEKLSQRSPGKSEETFRQKEASVLKTVALMQLGFTVTLGEKKLKQLFSRRSGFYMQGFRIFCS